MPRGRAKDSCIDANWKRSMRNWRFSDTKYFLMYRPGSIPSFDWLIDCCVLWCDSGSKLGQRRVCSTTTVSLCQPERSWRTVENAPDVGRDARSQGSYRHANTYRRWWIIDEFDTFFCHFCQELITSLWVYRLSRPTIYLRVYLLQNRKKTTEQKLI